MILVYTPVIKPRIQYIFKHFFCVRMEEEISFTSDLSTFIAHIGPKMSYADAPLGNEFFMQAHGLLAEQGINAIEARVFDWDGLPAFFASADKSALPFDFFAASFYLLTRYEEYHPYVSDELGRFTATQSLAHQYNFLHTPLVDLWFERFLNAWNAFFGTAKSPTSKYSKAFTLLVDVPQLYAFKHKGVLRSFFEGIRDLTQLKFVPFFDRVTVGLGFRKDPLEGLLNWLEDFIQKQPTTPMFFVLHAALGIHDKGLSVFNAAHQQGIKSLSDFAPTAPLASYESFLHPEELAVDIERFSGLIHRPVKAIRQHHLALRFPNTYRKFAELGIKNDYSMQYPNLPGFRASTAFPFRFYDLSDEQQTPLTIHPVCISEAHLRKQRFSRKMRQLFLEYQNRLQELGAPFVVALTNESFNLRSHNGAFLKGLTKLLTHA